MASGTLVNIVSGNGLMPDGTKPLPKPLLTYHQQGPVAFISEQFHKKCSQTLSTTDEWINQASVWKHYILQWLHMSVMVSYITATLLFVHQFIQAKNKENSKVLHYWPFAMEIFPLIIIRFSSQRATNAESVSMSKHHHEFPFIPLSAVLSAALWSYMAISARVSSTHPLIRLWPDSPAFRRSTACLFWLSWKHWLPRHRER